MKRFIQNNQEIVAQFTGVGKKYEIHHEKPTLVEKFVKAQNETFWALQNINITIRRGERIGIIGLNGSGKTTFLKIIAGITSPTTGTVKTHGKIVSLIDLEAGFHPDLTGEQNIYLNGMLLGLSKHTINRLLPSIISFADVGQFIDAPLMTYSEGMKLRLGFAIAILANPDILVLDEMITVGDKNFQKKSQKKITEFTKKNNTILIVSHRLDLIERMSTRILVFKKGKIVADGTKEIIASYQKGKI